METYVRERGSEMEWKSFRTNWRATLLAKLGNAQVLRLIESTHDSQPARYRVIAFANMVGMGRWHRIKAIGTNPDATFTRDGDIQTMIQTKFSGIGSGSVLYFPVFPSLHLLLLTFVRDYYRETRSKRRRRFNWIAAVVSRVDVINVNT